MTNNGIFIMSLNSSKFDEFFIEENLVNDCIKNLSLFAFDLTETLNGVIFNNQNLSLISDTIQNKIKKANRFKDIIFKNSIVDLILESEIQKNLITYEQIVYQTYLTNKQFKSHCHNQIFRNLQPKLKKLSILKNSDQKIGLLAPYILKEIAFYLYLFDTCIYNIVYGLENEMEIIKQIKNNKYQAFTPYLKSDLTYIKIEKKYYAKAK